MPKQPRFETEDIERLFRALLPTSRPDPFGEIEQRLLELGEALLKGEEATETWRGEVKDSLASIQKRTFGIMVLQIFNALRFFFGLLPHGRIILIIVAVLGLAQTLLKDEPVRFGDIREAVANTGIADYMDEIMAEIQRVTDLAKTQVDDLTSELSVMFQTMSTETRFVEGEIDGAIRSIQDLINRDFGVAAIGSIEHQDGPNTPVTGADLLGILDTLQVVVPSLGMVGNVASNGALFLPGILRGLRDLVGEIPAMARRLVVL